MTKWSLWHYPSLGSSSVEKLSRFLVYSEDIPAAFHLHFVNYPQVPMYRLLEYILSIWQGICSFHAFVVSPEFFLPPILPGPVSRSVVGKWLSGHRWWIWSTELTCLRERLGAVLSSEEWLWDSDMVWASRSCLTWTERRKVVAPRSRSLKCLLNSCTVESMAASSFETRVILSIKIGTMSLTWFLE